MTTALPLATNRLVIPTPNVVYLTLGNFAGSGCNFDPGTNPTTGDSVGNDCAAALQAALNASVAAPYNANNPAKIVCTAAGYQFWQSGTTPSPILSKSGRQFVEGASMRGTAFTINSTSAQSAITVTASPFTFTNAYGFAVIVKINTNGATWSTATPVQVNGNAMLVPDGSGSTNTQWNTFAGSISVCVQNGGTITLTYSAGTPALTANLSFYMQNVDPAGGAGGTGLRNLSINSGTNSWGHLIDYSNDPNNGLAYTETTKPVVLENIFTSGTALTDTAVILDGCEGASVINPDMQGGTSLPSLSWVVPKGQLQIVGGFVTAARLGGQVMNILGTALQNNSDATTGIQVVAIGATNLATVFPMNLNLYGAYFNSGTPVSTVSPVIDNQNAATPTAISVYGGEWLMQAGTAPAGYIISNIATLTINFYGSITFRKLTNNPLPLTASAPAGFAQNGNLQFLGAETQAAFLVHSLVGWQLATPAFPATGVAATNATGIPVTAYITATGGTLGTISAVGITDPSGSLLTITGPATGFPQGYSIPLDVGGKVTPTIGGGTLCAWRWYGRQA